MIVSAACTAAVRSSPPTPNILIFVTDDQRAEGTLEVMPNVRRWFGEAGTSFPNAFATTPLCCPSRASIFSGRYAHNHGVKHNFQSHALEQSSTMQRHLHLSGYRTAIAGKFLNQWGPDRPPPYFDRFAIFLEGEYYDRQWNLDGVIDRLPDYTNDVIRRKSMEFLAAFEEENDRAPWFLYIGTNAGHAPFTAEPRFEQAPVPPHRKGPAFFEEDLSDKPVVGEIRNRSRSIRARQLRTFMSADDLVDDVMGWLEEHEELDDTAAIFMSDNGMQWGEHGFTGKRQPYSPSVRIPLFLRLPGGGGGVDRRLAANIDIAPTVLDIAGVDPPLHDGLSLLGEETRNELLLEHWGDAETRVPDWVSLLTLDRQYVEYSKPEGEVVRTYFDLDADPHQLRNLLADDDRSNDPKLVQLHRRLARARACVGTRCP